MILLTLLRKLYRAHVSKKNYEERFSVFLHLLKTGLCFGCAALILIVLSPLLVWIAILAAILSPGIYLVYYLIHCVHKPIVLYKNVEKNENMINSIPLLDSYYYPPLWCTNKHLQTLASVIARKTPDIEYRREYLVMEDGGEIIMDWYDNEESRYQRDIRPTVVLLHGMTGNSNSPYIKHMVHVARKEGYRAVVVNNRGMAGTLKSAKVACASFTSDMKDVTSYIVDSIPQAPLVTAGLSYGSAILMKYLAEVGENCPYKAAMAISVPWSIEKCMHALESADTLPLYNVPLSMKIQRYIKDNMSVFENIEHIDIDHVMEASTMREIDERFTLKMHGYSSLEEYYKDADPRLRVSQVKIPLMCMSALDDPFAPVDVKKGEIENVVMVLTRRGGHVAFLEDLEGMSYSDKIFCDFMKYHFESESRS
eukprot:Nk52_evm95s1073 gene=Nk52_evmTU95s1073